MSNRRKIGILGEEIAQKYLISKGYEIKDCNYWKRHGEIDIIAIDKKGVIAFCEVKTRTNSNYGTPQDAVTPQKQLKILKTADSYLKEYPVFLNCRYCIDVIAVELNFSTNKAKVRHIKNAISDLDFEDS